LKTRIVLRAIVVIAALVMPTIARAESARVLLVHAGSSDPITAHLVDELVALGFTVEIVPLGDYDLATLAKRRNARAVMRVEPSRRGIEVWTTSKGGSIRIEEKPAEKGDVATLSLRAVEELRGQLLAATMHSGETRRDEPPTPDNPHTPQADEKGWSLPNIDAKPRTDPVRPSEPRRIREEAEAKKSGGQFWLHIAPAAIVHPGSGGMSTGATVLLGARFMPLPRFGADLVAFVPIIPSTITSPGGNVNIAASGVLLGGWIDVFRPLPALGIGIGAGVGGGIFHHYGQPRTSGIEARDGNVAYGLPYARSAMTWAITTNMALRADVLAAIATPRPVIRLPGATADVYFGQPLLTIGLGLDLKLK
jgi:hypothetical protein